MLQEPIQPKDRTDRLRCGISIRPLSALGQKRPDENVAAARILLSTEDLHELS
jgi:hypothetical protein